MITHTFYYYPKLKHSRKLHFVSVPVKIIGGLNLSVPLIAISKAYLLIGPILYVGKKALAGAYPVYY